MPEQLRATLDFLRVLRGHNDREWFEANRGLYERARAAFQAIVAELIDRFDAVDDLGGIDVRACVFRINRDLRFSKDKSPYKLAMSALLGRQGRKTVGRSYYFHIEPDGRSMLAGGMYEPSPRELAAVRDRLAKDARPFKRLISAPDFVRAFGKLDGDSLKTAPQGFAKNHPEIELLRLKQYVAIRKLDDAQVLSKELIPLALETFAAMKPFTSYLEKVAAESL
jgi:uncharacterized protein (TIGR02453 family)